MSSTDGNNEIGIGYSAGALLGPLTCPSCHEPYDEAHPGYGQFLTVIGYKANFEKECDVLDGSMLLGSQNSGEGALYINVTCDVCDDPKRQWLFSELTSHMVQHALDRVAGE